MTFSSKVARLIINKAKDVNYRGNFIGHRNVKLFITQGSKFSVTEAIYYRVPMIGVPSVVDQFSNVAEMARRGFAIQILYHDLSKETLKKGIAQILDEPKWEKSAPSVAAQLN